MIIGIDVSSVPYGTGVSDYTLNIVRHILKRDKSNHYKIFFSSLRREMPAEIRQMGKQANVSVYHHRLPLSLLQFIWNKLHKFPIELFIGRCDVFHTSDWTQPPTWKARTVCTIHDMTPLTNPEWHHKRVIESHSNKLKWAVAEAERFICVSKNTKDDFLRVFPQVKENKIDLVYEAADDKYEKFMKKSKSDREKRMAVISEQYGFNNYFLALGTREPRKNLERLIEAYVLFKKKNPNSKAELVITGRQGWGGNVEKFSRPDIKILGFFPEKDIVALHASALALVYPSLYEGFGLPVVKSMKVGVPVIVSNSSCLPEVAGKAGLLINPYSVEDIEMAIEKVAKSSVLRRRMISKGYQQAKKFSWKLSAKETIRVYEKTIQS